MKSDSKDIRARLKANEHYECIIEDYNNRNYWTLPVENALFKANIRKANPCARLPVVLTFTYFAAISLLSIITLAFQDVDLASYALIGISVTSLFLLSAVSSKSTYSLLIKLLCYTVLLAAAASLFFVESWQIPHRPQHPFGIALWSVANIPVWIGPRIIGITTFLIVNVAILIAYEDYMLSSLLKEAARQTKNFETLLVSHLTSHKRLELKDAFRLANEISQWLQDQSPGHIGQFDTGSGLKVFTLYNKSGLNLYGIDAEVAANLSKDDFAQVEHKWLINIDRTFYFY